MVQADDVPAADDDAVTLSLVERLRKRTYERSDPAPNGWGYVKREHPDPLCQKAADEIERLSAELDASTVAVQTLDAVVNNLNDECERLRSQGGAPEPTDDMAEAGRDWAQREWKASGDPKGYLDFYRGVYSAMLSAAPQPPVSESVQPPEGGTGWRNALDELLGACQRYDADPCSTLAIADYLEAKDHAAEVLAAASSAPGSVPTSLAGHKILDGLRDAVAGDLPRVTIEGVTYVRQDEKAATSLAGQVPDGYVLVPKAAIRWLLAERDEAISAARTALQSSPQPTAGGDAPTEWTEGVCEDGAAILRDGQAVSISDLLAILNRENGALSAERARVIELETALKGAIANLEHVSVFDEADDDDQEAIEARSAWRRDLDRFRAALLKASPGGTKDAG